MREAFEGLSFSRGQSKESVGLSVAPAVPVDQALSVEQDQLGSLDVCVGRGREILDYLAAGIRPSSHGCQLGGVPRVTDGAKRLVAEARRNRVGTGSPATILVP